MVLQIVELFSHLQRKLNLSIPANRGYRFTLNHVFALDGTDLATSRIISKIFSSFKKMCPPKVKPSEWNLPLFLRSCTRPPHLPLKLSSDKHLTWKTCFSLALTSAKRVSELHGFSY